MHNWQLGSTHDEHLYGKKIEKASKCIKTTIFRQNPIKRAVEGRKSKFFRSYVIFYACTENTKLMIPSSSVMDLCDRENAREKLTKLHSGNECVCEREREI
jgi:hypothetical protein